MSAAPTAPATLRSRQERARAQAGESGFDALYVTAGPNFSWLAGGSPYPGGLPIWLSALILPAAGGGVAVVSTMHDDILELAEIGLEDVVTYEDGDEPVAVLRRALAAAGLGPQSRIGVEDAIVFADVEAIRGAEPDVRLGSAQAVFDRLRSVKDAGELELLRASGRAVDAAYAAARDSARAGGTMAEPGVAMYRAMLAAGASQPHVSGSFKRYGSAILRAGDVLDVDIGAEVGGYSVDTARNLFVGEPDAKLVRDHDLLEEAFAASFAAARPGAPCEAVHAACIEVIEGAGHHQSWKVGHGVGLASSHEAPLVQPGNTTPLEPGMVFTIDPGFFIRRDEPLHLEETVVVTESGCERMTAFPLGMLVAR
jgi:Xaa-Pro dipeptidase